MKIISREQMIRLDRQTIQGGTPEKILIERAGLAAARWIRQQHPPAQTQLIILAGKGNNGADARTAARYLKKWKYKTHILAPSPSTLSSLQKLLSKKPSHQTIIIDGIFGTGLNRPITGPLLNLLKTIDQSRLPIISLDIPSGLDANTGKPLGYSLHATTTLTFGLPKRGLVQEHAANHVGNLQILDIGFPAKLIQGISTQEDLITPTELSFLWPRRKPSAHKGDFGHVLVVGGSTGFAGAPALAAKGAVQTGAGLISLLVPSPLHRISSIHAGPEVMTHPAAHSTSGYFSEKSFQTLRPLLQRATSLVIGPGMGTHPQTLKFLEKLIRHSTLPMVLDADALNLLSKKTSLLKLLRSRAILTPHPGEMSRLTGQSRQNIRSHRWKIARDFSREQGVTLLLKGSRTVIAHPQSLKRPDGTSCNLSTNALAGNPGMASGGTGDVLAGIIGACLARGIQADHAARLGVLIHAMAGDLAMVGQDSLKASTLANHVPAALFSFVHP